MRGSRVSLRSGSSTLIRGAGGALRFQGKILFSKPTCRVGQDQTLSMSRFLCDTWRTDPLLVNREF